MTRDLMSEIVKLEPIIVELSLFYSNLQEYSDNIWEAFGRSDTEKIISSVDLFTINVPKRAWANKDNNGLQKLLDYTIFENDFARDIATGKRKVTSLSDL